MKQKLVSLVISAYNEEGNIDKLYQEIIKTIKNILNINFEIIFVNDGSKDNTLKKIKKLQDKDERIKIINFNRNYGHEIAMTAGMDNAKGDAVIFMDSDLQHPPFYIAEMIKRWQNGADIVLTKRIDNADTSKIYKFCACLFYKILNFLSDVKIPEKTPDFRLIDKKYIDFLKNFKEKDRMFRGLLSLVMPSENVEIIEFSAPERFSGQSKYNFFKSLKLAINAITQFSTRPLKLSIFLGIFVAIISLIFGTYVFFERFILSKPTPGYATIVCAITFIGAIQLIVLGIIGEYIGKIHMEVKDRPLYFADIIEKKHRIKKENVEKDNN